jgi:hypothetical protein
MLVRLIRSPVGVKLAAEPTWISVALSAGTTPTLACPNQCRLTRIESAWPGLFVMEVRGERRRELVVGSELVPKDRAHLFDGEVGTGNGNGGHTEPAF